MAIPFLNNINLTDNQLQNAKLHVVNPAPTAAQGQIYFDSNENVAKYHNGTSWVNFPRKFSVGGTDLAYSQSIDLVAGTNVSISESSGTITINSTDQFEGTVTNVSASTAGDALDVVVTNETTEPDLAFTWAGAITDYVNGLGNLVAFPTIPTVPSNIVETVVTTNGAFIDLTPATATDGNVTITADLSAGGTPSDTTYLRGDNSWEPISAIPGTYSFFISDNAPAPGGPITGTVAKDDTVQIAANADLTSNLTGESSTSKVLTVGLKVDGGPGNSDNYVVNQGTATAAADDTIPFNNFTDNANPALITNIVKKTTLGTIPVNALTLVKQYIDDSVAGGLVYQGGYNPTTDLTSPGNYGLQTPPNPNIIEKGWTYTVTADGTFFTEQVRVGDVLIAEIDAPTSLADWTTVQNNVDLASLTQVGIGNVNAGTGISVAYSAGTATVTNTDTNSSNTYATTISDTAVITHSLNTRDVIIELYDSVTYETVYADIERTSTTTATITFADTPTNSIRVLVQKIG